MKQYYIISDIHSFASIMKNSLKKAGFDITNPEHILIVCGDIFDRGTETIKVYNFLKKIPNERCILIRGNHESLYFTLLNKRYPEEHDFSNGTVLTFCQIAGCSLEVVDDLRVGRYMSYGSYFDNEFIDGECLKIWKGIQKKVQESPITQWLKSSQWVNYYELGKYIFVHSFIPLKFSPQRMLTEDYCIYYGYTEYFSFKEDWRESSNVDWEKASWGCPYVFFDAGLFAPEKEKGKILVCGHYRCSEFNEHYLAVRNNHNLYRGKNLIAIDATTALSKQINVLVLSEDEL